MPFAKTGGLGDVSGILPKVLAKTEKVSVMMPDYMTASIIDLHASQIDAFTVQIGERNFPVSIKKKIISAGLSIFFVSNKEFFGRKFLYGDHSGDYSDNFIRFFFFQQTVLAFAIRNGLNFDIIHCNDWQTAMIPLLIKLESNSAFFKKTKTVFSIHNLGYQGIFPAASFKETGLPDYLFSPEYLEFYGNLNCMKAGIIFSDKLVTVSPTYAMEIVCREKGFGLDGLLKKFSAKLVGIMNGVDYSLWDPQNDSLIEFHYSMQSLDKKIKNKQGLFAELGVTFSSDMPLMVMISRISEQKGIDLLLKLLPVLLQKGIYFIFLGVGDHLWADKLRFMVDAFPDKMTFFNRFDEKMAHRLEAAADILFMPSVYEPCGLNQIYSMKYGTIPIVRATGGLQDSVQEFDPESGQGTGFKFNGDNMNEIMSVINKALYFFSDKNIWRKIQKNGMGMDFSWEKVVPRYQRLYKNILAEDTQNG